MVRRFLLWALERWTGDRYVRARLMHLYSDKLARDHPERPLPLREWRAIDDAIDFARDHEAIR